MSSVLWIKLISAVVVFGLGTCSFLFRHTLKGIFVDPCCDPRLEFNGTRKKKITLSKCGVQPSDEDIRAQVAQEMQTISDNMPLSDLDPYKDMSLIFVDNLNAAKQGNTEKKLYLSSLKKYKYNKAKSAALESRYKPIKLNVVNRGNKGSGKLILKIQAESNAPKLYGSDKILINHNKVYDEPKSGKSYPLHPYSTPDLYLPSTKYEYLEVNTHAMPIDGSEIAKTIEDGILQTEAVALDPLYVDTTIPGEIVLKWRIIESSLGKNGNSGTLRIIVK